MESGERWAALSLDEVDPIDWRQTGIAWRPIRRPLGADIVGMAVFTAERPGGVVVESHTEVDDGRGQQEIYVVLRGAALFVIDGVPTNAAAGTFLRVDPQAHREATAIEPGEALLAVGRGDQSQARRILAALISDAPQLREVLRTDPDLRDLLPGWEPTL